MNRLIDPGFAEGRSKLLLFAGMGALAIGTMVDSGPVFWGGVAIVGMAFLLNTVGKLRHYGELPIPTGDRLKLTASWVLVVTSVVGLLANYAYTRYGPGNGTFFWSLAAASVGFGLIHLAAQSRYLPVEDDAGS